MFDTHTTIAGRCFEEYIISLFDKQHFRIINQSKTSDPDLTIEYIQRRELFCIECKFKSYIPLSDKVNWARRDLISQYESFERRSHIPTFIVIGIGNKPCGPDRVFCLPLEIASELTNLPLQTLESYERLPPDKMFFWRNGNLK